MEPSRNMITFSTFAEIDYKICSPDLCNILDKIKHIILDLESYTCTYTIRANVANWSIVLSSKTPMQSQIISIIVSRLLEISNCCYIQINDIIHHHEKYLDILDLAYHPLSFRQPDNTIRTYIMTYFISEMDLIRCNVLVCLGGECTLFGKLFQKKRKYFITDFQSIYDDLLYNYSSNCHITHVDYKTCVLDDILECNKYMIANTGYHGLGANLCQNLVRMQMNGIYIISCNKKSFQKDFVILSSTYKLVGEYEIRTNYSVWIYKLVLDC